MNGRELARFVGIPEARVYKWSKKGWLKPSRVASNSWTGEELWFSEEEQRVARQLKELVRAGMYPDAAVKIARGNVGATDRLLAALAPGPAVVELRYCLDREGYRRTRHWGGSLGELGPAGESEPCL